MALITGGTTLTTSLQGLRWIPPSGAAAERDVGTFNNLVKYQGNPAKPIFPGALSAGILDFPDRPGQINLLPGDYVFVDSNGWPIVVSRESILAAAWIHS